MSLSEVQVEQELVLVVSLWQCGGTGSTGHCICDNILAINSLLILKERKLTTIKGNKNCRNSRSSPIDKQDGKAWHNINYLTNHGVLSWTFHNYRDTSCMCNQFLSYNQRGTTSFSHQWLVFIWTRWGQWTYVSERQTLPSFSTTRLASSLIATRFKQYREFPREDRF